jgi:uncharacterized protein (DUF983 family)
MEKHPHSDEKLRKPGYLWNVLSMQCPRCRQGKIFKNRLSLRTRKSLDMHTNCPVCGQPTEIEVGFYVGTGYVSYALSVAFSGFTFVAWLVLIGFSIEDNRIFIWLATNAILLIVLQPWLMRLSRSIWLSWFVKYDKNWRENPLKHNERIISSQMEGVQDIGKEVLEKG